MSEQNPLLQPVRWIVSHEASPGGPHSTLAICTLDEPSFGGANHRYDILSASGSVCEIRFQKGPIAEHGVNGATIEALLAICADRLEAFQRGDFACAENQSALNHIDAAMEALHLRTRARRVRGVEGTNQA
jgi:hypothetical protein